MAKPDIRRQKASFLSPFRDRGFHLIDVADTPIACWSTGWNEKGARMISFLRRNWYYVGGVLCIVLAVVLAATWSDLGILRRLMLMNFMALLVHQFEEYGWPGGFPAVFNIAWHPGGEGMPDRFPLNRRSALFVNVLFAYPYYVLPILLPHQIWMGLAQAGFGMAQLVVHGVVINRKMRSVYNPGLFAVVFLHWPIGIYYIWYVVANGLVSWWTWPAAAVWLILGALMGVSLPVTRWFADRNATEAFSDKEMARFHVRERIGRQS